MNFSPTEWLRHPLAGALLRFNLFPSLLLHRQKDSPAGEPLSALPAMHRHRSAALIKKLGLDPVLSLNDRALPVAMLPDAHFDDLVVCIGACLNAPHIRRTVLRAELVELRAQLGVRVLEVVRTTQNLQFAGMPVAPDWAPTRAREICLSWGAAILASAFDAATPPVGKRARLRLPPESDALRAPLLAAGLQAEMALDACISLLRNLEPAWLSSFPEITG